MERVQGRDGAERNGWLPTLHPTVVAGAMAILGASLIFDVLAQGEGNQYVYARGSFVLVGIGLLVGVVGVIVLVAEIVGLPPGAPRRQGRMHLAVVDVALVWFAIDYVTRRSTSFAPQALWKSGLSGLVLVALAVSHVLELRQVEVTLVGGGLEADAPEPAAISDAS